MRLSNAERVSNLPQACVRFFKNSNNALSYAVNEY